MVCFSLRAKSLRQRCLLSEMEIVASFSLRDTPPCSRNLLLDEVGTAARGLLGLTYLDGITTL